jgi:hypothetical protein
MIHGAESFDSVDWKMFYVGCVIGETRDTVNNVLQFSDIAGICIIFEETVKAGTEQNRFTA